MSEHPNVTTINRMTKALVDQDTQTLGELLTDDFTLHLRGPYQHAGDHAGVEGLVRAIGSVFEATNGEVHLEQQFITGGDSWACEWERAVLGRNGKQLESYNAFVYDLDGGRIRDMWMFLGADPTAAEAFFA